MKLNLPKSDYLRIKVIPKSAKTEIVDILEDTEHGKTIKIRVKAAPERGKANEELIKFLSKEIGISSDKISIISGKTDRIKLIRIHGPVR